MAEETKMMVCKFNLRPRLSGKATLIEAGTPFPEAYVDDDTKKVFLEQGNIAYVDGSGQAMEDKPEEAKAPTAKELAKQARVKLVTAIKDKFDISITAREFTKKGELQAEYDRLKQEYAPKGFFTKTPEELEDFNLDELDALHVQICSENNLNTPDPFESKEQAVAKLTGAEG